MSRTLRSFRVLRSSLASGVESEVGFLLSRITRYTPAFKPVCASFLFCVINTLLPLGSPALNPASSLYKKSFADAHWQLKRHGYGHCKLVNVRDEGFASQSGDLIFFVKENGKKIFVIKIFVNNEHKNRFNAELKALNFLKKHSFTYIAPLRLLFSHSTSEYDILAMTLAPGQSLHDLMDDLDNCTKDSRARKKALKKVNKAVYAVGCALSELHSYKTIAANALEPSFLAKYEKSFKRVSAFIAHMRQFKKIDHDLLTLTYSNIMSELSEHGCQFCYIHGDAHPGNCFFENGKITFIDIAGLGHYQDNKGEPTGFSAHDYFHFLTSITFGVDQCFDFTQEEYAAIEQHFLRGYTREIDSNQKRFFYLYWLMRRVEFASDQLKRSSGKDDRNRRANKTLCHVAAAITHLLKTA